MHELEFADSLTKLFSLMDVRNHHIQTSRHQTAEEESEKEEQKRKRKRKRNKEKEIVNENEEEKEN